MDVYLIDYTGKESPDPLYAARLLVFTKKTRLKMDPQGWLNVKHMDDEELEAELLYMANTIQSSWEFGNVTFLIEGISRACAQQVTRTRNASYAMQSQRVTDVSQATVHLPAFSKPEHREIYKASVRNSKAAYQLLVDDGGPLEDARGLLPINTHCNLVAAYNLRSLVHVVKARTSVRTQGEYQELAIRMHQEVLRIWPWSEAFFRSEDEAAISLADDLSKELRREGRAAQAMQAAKVADLLRRK